MYGSDVASYEELLFQTQFFIKPYVYAENPEETRVIVGSKNMGYELYPMHENRLRV